MQIRGQEGRAGMAAILDPEQTTDFKALAQGIRKALPSYARPIIIRILSKVDLTGTYAKRFVIKLWYHFFLTIQVLIN